MAHSVQSPTFDLSNTYLHLEDGPSATLVPVDDDFWLAPDRLAIFGVGRLVGLFHMSDDWMQWEMHPDGDEIVYLVSGSINFVLEHDDGERVIELRKGTTCVVPRGIWHRALVHAPSEALHITRGAGTQHRPI